MPTVVKAYLGTTALFTEIGGTTSWARPTDWLTLPSAPEQAVHGLLAVFPNAEDRNLLAIQCQSNFKVDWGDGGPEEFFASNVQAQHQYDFASISADTLCSRGYKQVVVKVTPQAGQNITRCFLSQRHTAWGTNTNYGYSVNWLDLNINLPNLGAGAFLGITSTVGNANLLERCNITSWGALTSAASLFARCRALQSLNEAEWNLSGVTSLSAMFQNCDSLRSLDCSNWNTSAVTVMNAFAQNCSNLTSFKGRNWNLSVCANLSSAFSGCSNLTTCEVENWQLRQAPVTMDGIFNLCTSLPSLNLTAWNTSKATTLASLFNSCRNWTDFSSIKNWNTSSVTSLQSTFSGVGADTLDISAWNIAAVTNLTDTFNACTRLRTVKFPVWPTATVTTAGASFCATNYNLQDFAFASGGIRFTGTSALNFSNCALSATELNAIYTALADLTGQTGKTINVTNNFGVASDNPAIATAKNWTVTG